MSRLLDLDAGEILDSRGRPTLEVTCRLGSGASATAQVPSGASTGSAEALELRDGDPQRHAGLGCLRAVGHVTGQILPALQGRTFSSQAELDGALIELDGTPNKARLGANAILGVSLAFARAQAVEENVQLFEHFARMAGITTPRLPAPTINLLSGGLHAGGQVSIQDILLVPRSSPTLAEGLEATCAVFRSAANLLRERYGSRLLVADEGGLAPDLPSIDALFSLAVEAIERAGKKPGEDFGLAVDVASSHFYDQSRYRLEKSPLTSAEMVHQLADWVDRYPIVSLEDGLAEEDWEHWPELVRRLGSRVRVMGDDFLCTQPARIRRAQECKAANALLLKVNQIGTLTEALEAYRLARAAGWQVTVSARSGETEDHWLADLATGWAGDHIKIGSVTRSERLAKYNRLLTIERQFRLPLARPLEN